MAADLQDAPVTKAHAQLTLELARSDSGDRARRLTEECLHTWGLEALSYTAKLVVMELFTNVIDHTNSALATVCLYPRSTFVVIEVTDYDPRQVPIVQAEGVDELPESGRGMFLVAALARMHGHIGNPGGGWTRFAVIEVA